MVTNLSTAWTNDVIQMCCKAGLHNQEQNKVFAQLAATLRCLWQSSNPFCCSQAAHVEVSKQLSCSAVLAARIPCVSRSVMLQNYRPTSPQEEAREQTLQLSSSC
jgi:hypothetical protein